MAPTGGWEGLTLLGAWLVGAHETESGVGDSISSKISTVSSIRPALLET